MPYKRLNPATEREMKKERYKGHYTICQTLRDIWEMTNDPVIKEKCQLAMAMAKRMHEHMKDYKVYRESKENQEE